MKDLRVTLSGESRINTNNRGKAVRFVGLPVGLLSSCAVADVAFYVGLTRFLFTSSSPRD